MRVVVPETTDKTYVGDLLRTLAKTAGCEQPVVEVESPDTKHFVFFVYCRDEGKP